MASILDFARTEVFNADIGRRKLGVFGATDPSVNVNVGSLELENPLSAENGGTGVDGCSIGDVLVCVAPNLWARLPAGLAGQVLMSLGVNQAPAFRYPYPDGFYDGLVIDDGTVVTDGGEPVWEIPA